MAAIVVTLREAGLKAQPGSEEGVTLADDVLIVNGRLRRVDPNAKPATIGFGAGHGGVVAEMTLSHLSGGGKRQLTGFAAEGARKPAAMPASRSVAIAVAATAAGSPGERLPPDVETQARSRGRAAGEKIVVFAREQGWFAPAVVAEAALEPNPANPPQARPKRPAAAAKPDGNPDKH